MTDKGRFNKIFEERLCDAVTTESIQHIRLCVDQKDNISLANLVRQWSGLTEKFVQVCPSDTKKTIDIVITPTVEKQGIPKYYQTNNAKMLKGET
jgi:hypothetical protein